MHTLLTRSGHFALLVLAACIGAFLPSMASAVGLPSTYPGCANRSATVGWGGTVNVNLTTCHFFGLGVVSTAPTHGTATPGDPAPVDTYNYNHNGSSPAGGGTDTFVVLDDNSDFITVTVTIQAPTSPITVTPATLPAMSAGTSFSQTLTSSGGLASYTYTLQSGALPLGLTLSSGGVISGTPTQRGGYGFTVRSTDATTPIAQFADKGYSGTVNPAPLSITPTSATAIQSALFSQTLTVNGGVAPHSCLLETGTFPAGIGISSGCVISGTTAAAPGNYPVTVRVTDSSTGVGSHFELESFTLTVSPPPSVSIAVSPTSVNEDGVPNLTFTVTRSLNISSPTTVNLTTGGTATSGVDFTGDVATVSIPAGATSASVTIDPVADATVEPNETVTLSIAAGTGYSIGASSSATGTISNDDLAQPTLTLTKISQGGIGAFTFTGTNGWLSQSITTTTAGVGVSGATQTLAAAGVATTISESLPAGYLLTGVSCTGMGSGGTATLVGNTLTLSAAATAAGANIACTFTNTRLPTLTLTKISQGGIGAFTFTGTNGWASQTITTSVPGVGVSGATQTLAAAGVATTISESLPAGYLLTGVSCTGMGSGGTATLVGNTLTLSAAATAAGANIACTFTNTRLPTLTLTKISQGGIGAFTFTGTNGWASQTITTSVPGVGVSGATQTLASPGSATTISESLPPGYSLTSVSCTGMGSGGSAILSGSTLNLNAAATAAGANIACSFTNTSVLVDAVNDSFGPINGASGATTASVLANDTQGGNPATVGVGGNVVLTPGAAPPPVAGAITMNPDGSVTVAPGTTAGTYAYPYTVCEQANPANCDTATATIVVSAAVIDAVDDTGTVGNGASGGVAVANVLVNDVLDGVPATLVNVTMTQISTTHPNVTLNPATGAVNVAPSTPAGTFTVIYRICEQLNPTNCDTATVTVTFGAAPIDAVDDAGVVANGALGGVAVANVLVNDMFNGGLATLSNVTLTQTSTTHPNVTLNPLSGAVSAAPGTPPGMQTVVYAICDLLNPTSCDSASVVVTTFDPPPVASGSLLTVAYNAAATNVPLNLAGGAPTSLTIGVAPTHGSAIVSGTTISYQPTTGYAGPDSFTYTATNGGGTSAPATVSITVQDPVITITPSGGFSAAVAIPYTQTFTFNGGATPWSGYQVTNLPAGLSVTGTAANTVTVSGTPTQAGSFNLNVSATDSSTGTGPYNVGQTFTLSVAGPTLTMTPAPGTLNAPYATAFSQTFTASGGIGPYTYVLTGTLPAGLSLSAGAISGTPTVPGSYPITITATDSGSSGTGAPFSIAQNYTIDVPAPTIIVNPASVSNGTAGAAYGQTLSGSGGVGPYAFAVSAGSLPTGVALSGAGALAGTPTSAGTFNFTVTATDANGQSGQRPYAVNIAVPTLTLLPATLPAGVNGTPYNQTFTAAGGVAPYSYALTGGTLPTGLTLGSNGNLSGTPSQFGNFSITVTATDSTGGTAATISQNYALTISPVIVLSTAGVPGGIMGVPYTGLLSASGGAAPYSFAVTGGSLPPGLTMAANGAITGTPSNVGSWTFTVTTTDSQGFTGTAQVTIGVATPYTPVPAMGRWAMVVLVLTMLAVARLGATRLG